MSIGAITPLPSTQDRRVIFSFSCMSGAILGKSSEPCASSLSSTPTIWLAFQIVDYLLDIEGMPTGARKTTGQVHASGQAHLCVDPRHGSRPRAQAITARRRTSDPFGEAAYLLRQAAKFRGCAAGVKRGAGVMWFHDRQKADFRFSIPSTFRPTSRPRKAAHLRQLADDCARRHPAARSPAAISASGPGP